MRSPTPKPSQRRSPPFDINATATYHLADYFHNYATAEDAKAALSSWGLWQGDAPRQTTFFPDEAFPEGPNLFQGSVVTIAWIPVWLKEVGTETNPETGLTAPILEQQPGVYTMMRTEGRPIPWPDPLPQGMFLMPLWYSPVQFLGTEPPPLPPEPEVDPEPTRRTTKGRRR